MDLDGTLLDTNYTNLILYSAVELLKIKEYKDQIYFKYLNLTKVNYLLYYLILELHKTNRIILLTNTNKNRADELIKFL